MSVTMTCNRCSASITSTATEAIRWDMSHDEVCPVLNPDDATALAEDTPEGETR